MRPTALAASIMIHVAVVGALVWRYTPNARPQEPEPIYFEILEEALAEESAEEPENQVEPEPQELEIEPIVQEAVEPQTPEVIEPQMSEVSLPEPPEAPQSSADCEHAAIVSPPTAMNRITPVYPRSARRKGREGCVTLEVRVSPEGNVVDATIVATSGFADLDHAALDAASSARFAPATQDDTPIEGCVRLTFDFKLK